MTTPPDPRDVLIALLMQWRLSYTFADEDTGYPLVDALSSPGAPDISSGKGEIELLADEIAHQFLRTPHSGETQDAREVVKRGQHAPHKAVILRNHIDAFFAFPVTEPAKCSVTLLLRPKRAYFSERHTAGCATTGCAKVWPSPQPSPPNRGPCQRTAAMLEQTILRLVKEHGSYRNAAQAVLADLPLFECQNFHHRPEDRHTSFDCPVLARFCANVSKMREALRTPRPESRDGEKDAALLEAVRDWTGALNTQRGTRFFVGEANSIDGGLFPSWDDTLIKRMKPGKYIIALLPADELSTMSKERP